MEVHLTLHQEAVDRLLAYNNWFEEQVQVGLAARV
jgi:hypothetical protein